MSQKKSEKHNLEKKLDKEINDLIHIIRDPEATYFRSGRVSYQDFLSDKMLIISAIRAGIPYSLFNIIRQYTPFTDDDWANLLGISTKSLHRYKQKSEGHHFKPLHSEKIIEMAEVTQAGLEVFGNLEKLRLWLNTPNYALGNQMPVDLIKDSYGKELVLAELTRINHGILA